MSDPRFQLQWSEPIDSVCGWPKTSHRQADAKEVYFTLTQSAEWDYVTLHIMGYNNGKGIYSNKSYPTAEDAQAAAQAFVDQHWYRINFNDLGVYYWHIEGDHYARENADGTATVLELLEDGATREDLPKFRLVHHCDDLAEAKAVCERREKRFQMIKGIAEEVKAGRYGGSRRDGGIVVKVFRGVG